MQNAVDYQKSQAIRDFDIGLQNQKAQAVGKGAFGGSRQAIVEAEGRRNLGSQLQGIQATGTQKAFEDAQRQQQFGANLGLQGLQAGYGGLGLGMQGAQTGLQGVGQQLASGQLGLQGTAQGMQGAQAGLQGIQGAIGAGQYGLQGLGTAGTAASQLGQIGQTQFGQEQAISAEQQKIGAIQQAQAQQALDLGYQDFLKQKNYPYQQLAFQSDMLRGLPLSQQSQSIYSAPPSMGSQLGGLGMSALGIYGMSGGFKAKGGMVGKGYAEGGKVGYATGGDIKMMKTEQLMQLLENPGLTPLESDMVEKELMLRRRMEMNPETDQIMAGITAIPTGEMVPEQMAGGGIVAFSQGGNKGVQSIKDASQARQSYRDQLEREVLESMKRLKTEDPFKESRAQDEQIRAQMAESKRVSPYEALAMAGLRTMAGTSQYGLANLGAGGEEGVKTLARSKREEADLQKQLLQQGVEREKSQFGRQAQLLGAQQTALGQLYGKEADIERTRFAKAQLDQGKETQNLIAAQRVFDNALKAEKTNLFQQNKARFNMDYTSPELDAEATKNVMSRLTPAIKNMLFPDGLINPAAAAVPAPVDPSTKPKSKADEKTKFKVTLDGKTFGFPTQQALDDFKKLAGVK
jgi:YHS domain-containing protein